MSYLVNEMIGTMLLVLLGDGVYMNLNLNKSGQKGGSSAQIGIGWGLAVMIPAFIFGSATGAHFNPAVSIAMAIQEELAWSLVPMYIIGQLIGAFLGAAILTVMYHDHLAATPDDTVKRGCYCTSPSVRNIPLNLFSEFVDTFILVFAICGIGQTVADSTGVNYVYVFAIITAIAFSFGGVTGFALNPARDLSPRIAYYLLCPGEKKDPDWSYAWVPVVGPVCGAVAAVLVYGVLPLPM